jgi:hypothetical protein
MDPTHKYSISLEPSRPWARAWSPALMAFALTLSCSSPSETTSTSSAPSEGASTAAASACAPSASTLSLDLKTHPSSKLALARGDDTVGIAYFDEQSRVALQQVADDGSIKLAVATTRMNNTKYVNFAIDVAYNAGRYGLTYSFERTPEANTSDTNWPSVGFAAVPAGDTRAAGVTMANRDLDRTGGGGGRAGGPVHAEAPQVVGLGSGFFVSWEDVRTAEPRRSGANLAYWPGIYGRAFASNGDIVGDDVQIQQENRTEGSFSILPTRQSILAVWARNEEQAPTLRAKVGPVSGAFKVVPAGTPASPSILSLRAPAHARIASAQGSDGNILVAVPTGSTLRPLQELHVALLDEQGGARTSAVAFSSQTSWLDRPIIVATSSGYRLAFVSRTEEGQSAVAQHQLHLLTLNMAGEVIEKLAMPLTGGPVVTAPVLQVEDNRTKVYFVSGEASVYTLESLTFCHP